MSSKVELHFRNADENDVIPIMLAPDSGFREDPESGEIRKPLEWGASESLALIGVVVAVAQLAVSIYEILRQSPGSSVEVRPQEPDANPIVIEGEGNSPEKIAQQIEESLGHDRG